MKRHTVSVAVCTYNGEKYIREQLESILHQAYPVYEVVICDDGSTDKTLELAEQTLRSASVQYNIQRNEKNLGVTKNFEKAISLCTGEIIFTSDQDDLWDVHKTKRMLESFADPQCVMVFSDAAIIDRDGKEVQQSLYKKDGFMQSGHEYSAFVDDIVRLSYTVYGCTMAFRREFVKQIMPFYQSEANHDAWIMCCAGYYGKVVYLAEPLISYRIHGNNCVGSIGGNPKWDAIAAKQDIFDRYFAIQDLRHLRIRLLREAQKRCAKDKGLYARSCKRTVWFFERILKAKANPIKGIWWLFVSLFNGSYRYRFCNRGSKLSVFKMMKQLPHDLLFLLKWRRTSN